jgi:hypothetical protein
MKTKKTRNERIEKVLRYAKQYALYYMCINMCCVFQCVFNMFECVLDVLSKLAEIGNVTASENVRRTENT